MSTVDLELRPFKPGTTGWTATDLDDPEIERLWLQGRYEIVEGVLTSMPAAFYAGGESLVELIYLIKEHGKRRGTKFSFSVEVDVVVSSRRVARSDAAMLLPDARQKQRAAIARKMGKVDTKRTRVYVPPTLIIESLSPGHEDHDLATKRQWYADFGVPHYWILNAFAKELLCLRLEAGGYAEEVKAREAEIVRPSLFPGLTLELKDVWED
jgi:Uma2 family endonuclease